MSLSAEIQAILKEAEADMPAVVTIGGTPYTALVSSRSKTRNLETGGYGIEADLVVTIRTTELTAPESKTELTHDDETFTIDRVVKAATGSHWRLYCVSASRGV